MSAIYRGFLGFQGYVFAFQRWLLGLEPVDVKAHCRGWFQPSCYFVLCVGFYSLYLMLMQPEWVLGGQMWAEMATNYYLYGTASEWVLKFFALDIGYVPFPQRLIAALGNGLNLPAVTLPYYYTWSAIFLTSGMVGVFCLAPFRALVKSDFLRFLAAVFILIVADFETRTFINVTYYAAFFISIVTALAFVENNKKLPFWVYSLPVLIFSKPALLATLPAMVIVSLVSSTRFRLITFFSVVLSFVQIRFLVKSYKLSGWVAKNDFGFFEKIDASFRYFLGFLGKFFVGEAVFAQLNHSVFIGLLVLFSCLFLVFKRRDHACVLILIGLSLIYFTMFLNAFLISDSWNLSMAKLEGIQVYRHTILAYFGIILIMTGVFSSLAMAFQALPYSSSFYPSVAAGLFVAWFVLSGWFGLAGLINRAPKSPVFSNSQWQEMAQAIDSGAPVCVPVDPLGWMFARNCQLLQPEFRGINGFNASKVVGYNALPSRSSSSQISFEPPYATLNKHLISLAFLLKPDAMQPVFVEAHIKLMMHDGTVRSMIGQKLLPLSGGLLMATLSASVPVNDIKTVVVDFNAPLSLGMAEGLKPVIMWMGH